MEDNKKSVEQLEKELAEAKELVAQQADTIAAQEAANAALKGDAAVLPTVTVDKKIYRITIPKFRFKAEGEQDAREFTAEELSTNAELAKALIAKKVGFLHLVETPKTK